jgi:exosortase A
VISGSDVNMAGLQRDWTSKWGLDLSQGMDSGQSARAMSLAALVGAGICLVYWQSAWSMISIWLRSDTFAHGFLIAPISLWLVWEKRKLLAGIGAEGAWLPIFGMLPVGLLWLVGHLVDITVVQQFAFVGMLILAVWATLGTRLARLVAFPLGFLFLAVPIGEGMVYPMMNFTADFTVGMLRLTGIPVFRDGTFFSIPTGDWSVVEACSGVRYLIASGTLGVLYAYLTYTKLWKRVLFSGFALMVPIIANGFRAYIIVMIGHLSGMRYAVGVDHLLYGWVFFGLVISAMFYIGSFWRDPIVEMQEIAVKESRSGAGRALVFALLAISVAALWPGFAWVLERQSSPAAVFNVKAPEAAGPWRVTDNMRWDWRPHVSGVDAQLFRVYSAGDTSVGLYIGIYADQRKGSELISSDNQMVIQKHPVWSEKERSRRVMAIGGRQISVEQSRLTRLSGERLLVWTWFDIGGYDTADPYQAKLREVVARLTGGGRGGALMAVATPYWESLAAAEAALEGFLSDMLDPSKRSIADALGMP